MKLCLTCGTYYPVTFKCCPACICVPLIEGENNVPEIENHPVLRDWFSGEGEQ